MHTYLFPYVERVLISIILKIVWYFLLVFRRIIILHNKQHSIYINETIIAKSLPNKRLITRRPTLFLKYPETNKITCINVRILLIANVGHSYLCCIQVLNHKCFLIHTVFAILNIHA